MAMQPIVMKLKLFRNTSDAERLRSRLSLLILLEALVKINRLHLRQAIKLGTSYPLLYESGVRYQEEDGTEEWPDIPTILEAGWGDCEDLACYRVAELRELYNVQAHPHIKWKKFDDRVLYHCLVRLPDGVSTEYSKIEVDPETGKSIVTEDPSRVLGMGSDWRATANVIMTAPKISGVRSRRGR